MIYDAEPQFIARRADLIDFIRRRLSVKPSQLRQAADELLPTLWRKFDASQQAAIAETAHGPEPSFDPERFEAKQPIAELGP